MAKNTRKPEMLREIFAALDNDPFVIAECLARPLLAERLIKQDLPPAIRRTSKHVVPRLLFPIGAGSLHGIPLPAEENRGACHQARAHRGETSYPAALV